MTKQDPWFFEERAVAFAKLVLTKGHDVRPYAGTDMGIDLLVEIRATLRSERQFALADQLRDRLRALGVVLEDTADGTKYSFERPSDES